jgi:membrane protease YdiL (CAAX protease family)
MPDFKIKPYLILIFTVLSIIPTFFGIFIEFLFISQLNLIELVVIGVSALLLITLSIFLEKFIFTEESLEIIKEHELISALISRKNLIKILFIFSLTMIMEEFIFRYYSIGILFYLLKLTFFQSVVISSIIFSLYHIHFWFKFKNQRITFLFIIFSFFLGLLNGFVLFTLGLVLCILIHYIIAFISYYSISRKEIEFESIIKGYIIN